MSDRLMPERLRAWENRDPIGSSRGWNTSPGSSGTEYVRADLYAALLAERDAAFAAGQEEMRERAAEQCDCALMDWEGDVLHDRAKAIRDLPIKDRSK